jgi:hypothetical protein
VKRHAPGNAAVKYLIEETILMGKHGQHILFTIAYKFVDS